MIKQALLIFLFPFGLRGKMVGFLLLCGATCGMAQVDSLQRLLAISNGKQQLEILNQLTVLDSTSRFSDYHRQAMQLAKELHDASGEIHALCAMGDHYYNALKTDSAILFYSQALALARKKQLKHETIFSLEKLAAGWEDAGEDALALKDYEEALSLSRKLADTKEVAVALEQLGLFQLYQRKDSVALQCFNEQLKLVTQLKDSASMAVCLNNIGLVNYNRGEYITCINFYQQSLNIENKLHKQNEAAQSRLNIGIVYKDQGEYEKSLENLFVAVKYFEKVGMLKELASCYNTIGLAYMEQKEKDYALSYLIRSLELRKKINNKRGIAGSYTNIAQAYKEREKYELALNYLDSSMIIKEQLGEKALLASSLDLYGEVYFLQKNYVKAEDYYLRSMQLKTEVDDPKGKATTLNNLGSLYLDWGKNEEAMKALEEAQQIAIDIGAKAVLLNNYDILIKVLRKKKEFEKAALYYDKYIQLNQDLFNQQKSKAISELKLQYDTEKNEQTIQLMKEQEKSQAAVVSKQHTLIFSLAIGAVLLVIIVLISLQAYRSGLKANRQSQIIIEQKQTMMRELHHRVKNNLQVLSSLLNLQQERLEDPATKEAIQAVEHRLSAMLLIHQDLYDEKVDAQVNIGEYLRKLVGHLLSSFGFSEEQMSVHLVSDFISVDADKALNIGFICNEVISNSFKHAFVHTEKPALNISLKKENESIRLILGDNGSGLSVESNIEKSNSFGLRLINLFIRDLKGTMHIHSQPGGSSFEFVIPIK